jgi:hypothetical protein
MKTLLFTVWSAGCGQADPAFHTVKGNILYCRLEMRDLPGGILCIAKKHVCRAPQPRICEGGYAESARVALILHRN